MVEQRKLTTPATLMGKEQELRDAVIAAARYFPRETPAPGGAATVHQFGIDAGTVWALDKALRDLDAHAARRSSSDEQAEVVAWTVRDAVPDDDEPDEGGVYEVMLPNGEWAGCVAVSPEDARETIQHEWEKDQRKAARYAAPVAMGGVTEAQVEAACAAYYRVYSSDGPPTLANRHNPDRPAMRAALTAALSPPGKS